MLLFPRSTALFLAIQCLILPLRLDAQSRSIPSADQIYSRSRGSVVTILTFDDKKAPVAQGSGFVLSRNRIVTNLHVLEGATSASIVFDDGASISTELVVSASRPEDLAILSVTTGNRPPLPLGDELSARVGEPVYAIGSPEGLNASLSNGLVSAFRQDEGHFYIQITASIAPGSSGGPLFNKEGKVIGITTSRLKDAGFGFAVGSGDIRHLAAVPLPIALKISSLTESAATPLDDLAASRELYIAKKYAEALTSLNKLPEAELSHADARLLACQIKVRLSDYDSALHDCDAVLRSDPTEGEAHSEEAIAYLALHRLSKAEYAASQAVKYLKNTDTTSVLGLIHYMQENYSLAKQELPATTDDTLFITAWEGLDLRSGDSDGFRIWSSKIAELKPRGNAWQLYLKGSRERDDLKFDDAVASFTRCETDDDLLDPICLVSLASVQLVNGEREEAKKYLDKALLLYPDHSDTLNTAIFYDLIEGDLNSARAAHHRLLDLHKTSDESDCLFYYGVNSPEVAETHCVATAAMKQQDYNAWANAGYAALDLAHYDEAATDFSKAEKLYAAEKKKHTGTQELDVSWGVILSLYFAGDKKDAKTGYLALKKEYPLFVSVQNLRLLALVWSPQTLNLVAKVDADFR